MTGVVHRPDLVGLIERLGLDPVPEQLLLCGRGDGGFRNREVSPDGDLEVSGTTAIDLYIASGTYRPGSLAPTAGRKAANVERVLWIGADVDLGTLWAFEREPALAETGGQEWTDLVANVIKPEVLTMADDAMDAALTQLREIAESVIRQAALPEPRVWVESGNGVYAWWTVCPHAGSDQRLCAAAARNDHRANQLRCGLFRSVMRPTTRELVCSVCRAPGI